MLFFILPFNNASTNGFAEKYTIEKSHPFYVSVTEIKENVSWQEMYSR